MVSEGSTYMPDEDYEMEYGLKPNDEANDFAKKRLAARMQSAEYTEYQIAKESKNANRAWDKVEETIKNAPTTAKQTIEGAAEKVGKFRDWKRSLHEKARGNVEDAGQAAQEHRPVGRPRGSGRKFAAPKIKRPVGRPPKTGAYAGGYAARGSIYGGTMSTRQIIGSTLPGAPIGQDESYLPRPLPYYQEQAPVVVPYRPQPMVTLPLPYGPRTDIYLPLPYRGDANIDVSLPLPKHRNIDMDMDLTGGRLRGRGRNSEPLGFDALTGGRWRRR